MEESEKRRERLRAMRHEAAAQSVNSDNNEAPAMPCYLSNPLVETSAAAPPPEQSHGTSRFDFYTDPMAAFSANKRRNNTSDPISSHHVTPPANSGSPMLRSPSPFSGPRYAGMSPAHQFQSNYSPNPRMYQPQGFGHDPISQSGELGMSRPFNMHQGNMDPSIGPGSAAGYYNFPSNQPRGSRFPSPRIGPTGSFFNAGQGRAHWHNHSPNPGLGRGGSPSPSLGRGGGRWHGGSTSPGSGRRGGRGPGSAGRHFTMDRQLGPERFYDESMIEDAWKFLEPVVWREVDASLSSLSTPDSSKSWITRSLGAKKAKVSDSTSKSGSQPSLAEYLAASFDEANKDESSA
ncbi:hypothetical protein L484_000896 [Morus notabilis]|uniref:Uncharacterized protein n=1 Tax=Morus notabilis TaxID=981085 RepID=W9SMI8_9ROSA|nr:protein SICKLE isoform X2 [Morus notabilis]EXC52457.1 hypothetical protein L484_000896 [Morus notabilis]